MTCKDCPYCWKAEDESYARCHFDGPDGWAPCEIEDDYTPDDYND